MTDKESLYPPGLDEEGRFFYGLSRNQALITHRLEQMAETLKAHGQEIESLKARRWPTSITAVAMFVLGALGLLFSLVKDFT